MNDLAAKFKDRWPTLFRDVPCGFWLPPGWTDLVWSLCVDLEAFIEEHPDMRVVQVKEKFGGLRFYHDSFPEFCRARAEKAESDSFDTCQTCGSTDDVHMRGTGWATTLCDTCDKAKSESS